MKMSKYFYACVLCVVLVSMLVISCVKIPTEAPPLPDLLSKVRLINAAANLDDAAEVTFTGITGETVTEEVNFGEASNYMTVDAGQKRFQLVGGAEDDTASIFLATDWIGSVYILDKAEEGDDRFLRVGEWWTYKGTPEADSAKVIFAQMCADTLTCEFKESEWTHPNAAGVRIRTFDSVVAGADTLIVSDDDGTEVKVGLDLTSQSNTTVLITGTIDDLVTTVLDNDLE